MLAFVMGPLAWEYMNEVIFIIMEPNTFSQVIIFPTCFHNKVCHKFHFFMVCPTFMEILFQ